MSATVTKITIGRLFNLGSYEHIRYEITVDLATGSDAESTIIGLETIMEALNPKPPFGVKTDSELQAMANEIGRISRMSRDEWEKTRWCELDQDKEIAEKQSELAKQSDIAERWRRRKAKARQLLNDLGGAVLYKDAKDDWDDQP